MPPPRDLDFWPFDLEVGVGVTRDLGYPCAKFRLPRLFGFRVRADVRDIRQTDDRRTTDADHRLMPPRRGHNNSVTGVGQRWSVRGSVLHAENETLASRLTAPEPWTSRDVTWTSTNRLDHIFGHNWTFSGYIRWSTNHVTSRRHHGRLTNCRGWETCRGCRSDRTW